MFLQLDLLCDGHALHKDSNLKFIWISHWLKKVRCMSVGTGIDCCDKVFLQS